MYECVFSCFQRFPRDFHGHIELGILITRGYQETCGHPAGYPIIYNAFTRRLRKFAGIERILPVKRVGPVRVYRSGTRVIIIRVLLYLILTTLRTQQERRKLSSTITSALSFDRARVGQYSRYQKQKKICHTRYQVHNCYELSVLSILRVK